MMLLDEQLQKMERGHYDSAQYAKKQCNFDSDWLERQQDGLYIFFWFSDSSDPTDLFGVGTELKESIFQNNQTTGTWFC